MTAAVATPAPTTTASPAGKVVSADESQAVLDLIEKQDWVGLKAKVAVSPQVATKIISRGGVSALGSNGNLALHEVCKHEPTTEILSTLIQANPDGVKSKGCWGYLPLHYACSSGASKEIIAKLIETFPVGLRTRADHEEALPLHLACKWGGKTNVVTELLVNYPEAIYVRDGDGKLPMERAKQLQGNRDAVMAALMHGPMLCACSRAAQRRVADENTARLRGMEEAHSIHVSKAESRHKAEREQYRKLETSLRNSLSFREQKTTHLTEQLEKKHAEIQELAAEKEKLIAANDEHVAHKMEKDLSIDALKGQIDLVTDVKVKAETDLSAEKKITADLTEKVSRLEELEEAVVDQEESIQALEAKNQQLEETEHQLSNECVKLESLRVSLEDELRTTQSQRDQLRMDNLNLSNEMADASKKLDIYQERLNTVHKWVHSISLSMDAWSVEKEWMRQGNFPQDAAAAETELQLVGETDGVAVQTPVDGRVTMDFDEGPAFEEGADQSMKINNLTVITEPTTSAPEIGTKPAVPAAEGAKPAAPASPATPAAPAAPAVVKPATPTSTSTSVSPGNVATTPAAPAALPNVVSS